MTKTKKEKALDLKQSKKKSVLHQNIRDYYAYKVKNPKGTEAKAPISMAQLKRKEATINKIRKQLKKRPITLIKSLEVRLKHLREAQNE